MDIEDWYHLDYFDRTKCDLSYSLLDGLETYYELLSRYQIPSSFFVLGELANQLSSELKMLLKTKHEVGSHGWNHLRPLHLSPEKFAEDLCQSKSTIENSVGSPITGYRAPCFSLDEERLKIIALSGYKYDSSRILFGQHPLYGTIRMDDFQQLSCNIFQRHDFFEFQVSTLPLGGRNIPVSGGGYLRIIPWGIMKRWVKRYLKQNELYVLYIHPFELSKKPTPPVSHNTKWLTRFRFCFGRSQVALRLKKLIELLGVAGFEFTTFESLRKKLLQCSSSLNGLGRG